MCISKQAVDRANQSSASSTLHHDNVLRALLPLATTTSHQPTPVVAPYQQALPYSGVATYVTELLLVAIMAIPTTFTTHLASSSHHPAPPPTTWSSFLPLISHQAPWASMEAMRTTRLILFYLWVFEVILVIIIDCVMWKFSHDWECLNFWIMVWWCFKYPKLKGFKLSYSCSHCDLWCKSWLYNIRLSFWVKL